MSFLRVPFIGERTLFCAVKIAVILCRLLYSFATILSFCVIFPKILSLYVQTYLRVALTKDFQEKYIGFNKKAMILGKFSGLSNCHLSHKNHGFCIGWELSDLTICIGNDLFCSLPYYVII